MYVELKCISLQEKNSKLTSLNLPYNAVLIDPLRNKCVELTFTGNSWSSQQQQQYHQPAEYTAGADIKQLAEYSASLYAQTPEEHASYVQYYTMYYQQQAQVR